MGSGGSNALRKGLVILAFAAIYLIWGSTYLAIRFAVDTLPPLLMAGARFFSAGIVLFLLMPNVSAIRIRGRHWGHALVAGALLFLGAHGLLCWAQRHMSSGIAALLFTTMPVWLLAFEWVFRHRHPATKALIGVSLGIGGVALLLLPHRIGQSSGFELAAVTALLGSPLLWAGGSVYVRAASLHDPLGISTAMQLLCGGALLLIAGLAAGEWGELDPSRISGRSLFAFLYLVVFGTLITFSAYSWLLRVADPALVGTYAFVNPAVAVTLGWILAGEQFDGFSLGAAAVIIMGVGLIVRSDSPLASDRAGRDNQL